MRTAVPAIPAGTSSPQAGRPAVPRRPVPPLTQLSSQPERLCPISVKLSCPLGCPLQQMEPPPLHCMQAWGGAGCGPRGRVENSSLLPLIPPAGLWGDPHPCSSSEGTTVLPELLMPPGASVFCSHLVLARSRVCAWAEPCSGGQKSSFHAPASDLLNSLQVPSPL